MVHHKIPRTKLRGIFYCYFPESRSLVHHRGREQPGPRALKTVLRTVFRARESPRFNGSMMGVRVEKRVIDPYSIRYYKTEGVFSACRLLFIGEIFSIAFYKELRLNKLEVSVAYLDFYIKPLFFASSINIG